MLNSIKIGNFKALYDVSCSLGALNIFSGLNGMGKSSFLQTLLLFKQTLENSFAVRKGLLLNGPILKLGKGQDVLCDYALNETISFCFEWRDGTMWNVCCSINNSDVLRYESGEEYIIDAMDRLPVVKMHYIPSRRIMPEPIYPASIISVEDEDFLGYQGEYTAHYIANHALDSLRIPNLRHPNAESHHFLVNLNKWLGEVTPNIRVAASYNPHNDTAELGYQFEQKNGVSDIYKPENVGFGVTYALPVITALLKANPGELLLIENPETYLHPAGQAAMGRLCAIAAANGVQLFVESHSDHFINGVRVAVKKRHIPADATKVFFLEKEQNQELQGICMQYIHIDEYGRLDNLPSGFCDEWDRQLDQLLDD